MLAALVAGKGRTNRADIETELPQRLAADGVKYDPEILELAIVRLGDVALIQRVQRQPYGAYPQLIVSNGLGRYDEIDVLAADVAAVIKSRSDEFENEDQLLGWLDQEQITYTVQTFAAALTQLEQIGRVRDLAPIGGTPRIAIYRAIDSTQDLFRMIRTPGLGSLLQAAPAGGYRSLGISVKGALGSRAGMRSNAECRGFESGCFMSLRLSEADKRPRRSRSTLGRRRRSRAQLDRLGRSEGHSLQ